MLAKYLRTLVMKDKWHWGIRIFLSTHYKLLFLTFLLLLCIRYFCLVNKKNFHPVVVPAEHLRSTPAQIDETSHATTLIICTIINQTASSTDAHWHT